MSKDRDITICLTSCGRFDLLEKTISSLVTYWDGLPPAEFLIHEDSGKIPTELAIDLNRFLKRHWQIEAQWNVSTYAGQVNAIDSLYTRVQTPYIFHCEDDWEFYQEGFIGDSRSVLEAEANAACVWIRHPNDRNGHTILPEMKVTKQGVRYQHLAHRFKGSWHGMTWSPGLRRLKDYKSVGTFGSFCEWRSNDHIISEMQYNKRYYEAGFSGMTLCRGFVKHIGNLQSIKKLRVK
jgi:hypothetical protein